MTITVDEIARWRAQTKAFPLPPHQTPVGGIPLLDIPDEILLDAPPQLIAHVQRTASQGGLQIVSPRQAPITSLMSRAKDSPRDLGDHIVGSVACPDDTWPTIDNADFSFLLPDEPLPFYTEDVVTREKTRTEPITRAGGMLSDPVLSCLVKGRALVDIQARDDVSGGADELAELIAAAWGMETKEFMDMDAFSIGIDGPLLRHAIRTDEVYPTTYGPIHVRRSISVGANEVTRSYLPRESAVDWRRLRVFCEAVFGLACSIEGIPLSKIICYPPPGDPGGSISRPNVLAFRLSACVVWTFAAETFSIIPNTSNNEMPKRPCRMPIEVMSAMNRYVETVRPISFVLTTGYKPSTRKTYIQMLEEPPGETLSQAYRLITSSIMIAPARGRTAAATVRNVIYETLEAAPFNIRLRLARYISIAKSEWKIHGVTKDLPDGIIDRLAVRFQAIGELTRIKIASEANRRGSNVQEWWNDILSQTPDRYSYMAEGTMGWTKVAFWLVFKTPTEKWEKLARATKYSAIRKTEQQAIGSVALPSGKGTIDRLYAACSHTASSMAKAFAGYYLGVSDVGMAIADELAMMGRTRNSKLVREGAYMWQLRARCLRGTNVHLVGDPGYKPKPNHYLVHSDIAKVMVVPTPYRAYAAYRRHAMDSDVLGTDFKNFLSEIPDGLISQIFATLHKPIATIRRSKITEYLNHPASLGSDLEKGWRYLREDVQKTADIINSERIDLMGVTPQVGGNVTLDLMFGKGLAGMMDSGASGGYFEILAEMPVDTVEWIEEEVDKLPEIAQEEMYMSNYESPKELMKHLAALKEEFVVGAAGARELVR